MIILTPPDMDSKSKSYQFRMWWKHFFWLVGKLAQATFKGRKADMSEAIAYLKLHIQYKGRAE